MIPQYSRARRRFIAVAIVGAWLLPNPAASEDRSAGEYDVKAAFLYYLSQFIGWPADREGDPRDAIVIGVLGRSPFGDALNENRPTLLEDQDFEVRFIDRLDDVRHCHVVYVGEKDEALYEGLFERAEGFNILTVGESELFAESGGMVGFIVTADRKVRFAVNLEAAKAADLKISSRFLQVATIVE